MVKNTAAQQKRSTLKDGKSKGFADPARIKEQSLQDEPKNGLNSPWDFRCPQYDQRSSNFVNAGTHYGVGINQPVGHKGDPKQRVDVLPFGRPKTMQVDDVG